MSASKNDVLGCSAGYKYSNKQKKCVFLKNVGYSSHGRWSTFDEIMWVEVVERGNPFPEVDYPEKTPAIWIAFDKKVALRYAVSVGDWDRLIAGGPLTREEKNIMRYDIVPIPLRKSDRIITDDGSGGYLLIRPH